MLLLTFIFLNPHMHATNHTQAMVEPYAALRLATSAIFYTLSHPPSAFSNSFTSCLTDAPPSRDVLSAPMFSALPGFEMAAAEAAGGTKEEVRHSLILPSY